MPRLTGYVRSLSTGDPVGSVQVVAIRKSDNVQVASVTTASNGKWQLDVDYDGAHLVKCTTGGYTLTYDGDFAGQIGTIFLDDLPAALRFLPQGIPSSPAGQLLVSPGTGLQVQIAPGAAIIYGHPYVASTTQTLTVNGNTSSATRIDMVALRLTLGSGANVGKIEPVIVEGAPSATPVAPTLITDPNSRWEIPLARVTVNSGAASFIPDNVVDARPLIKPSPPVAVGHYSGGSYTTIPANTTVTLNQPVATVNLEPGTIYNVATFALIQINPHSGSPTVNASITFKTSTGVVRSYNGIQIPTGGTTSTIAYPFVMHSVQSQSNDASVEAKVQVRAGTSDITAICHTNVLIATPI